MALYLYSDSFFYYPISKNFGFVFSNIFIIIPDARGFPRVRFAVGANGEFIEKLTDPTDMCGIVVAETKPTREVSLPNYGQIH